MSTSNLKFITSERGKSLLLYQNYKFFKHSELQSGEVKWRCSNKKCSSFVKTVCDSEITQENIVHQHSPPSDKDILRQELRDCAKRKASEDAYELPSKVIKKALIDVDPESKTLDLKDVHLVKRSIYKARRKVLPRLPRDRDETYSMLASSEYTTNRNEPFLLKSSEGSIIFSCKSNLQALCSSDFIYMDGTFKFCVPFFYQLFTIFSYTSDQYIPLVYCLLENKTKISYVQCLKFIKEECAQINLCFEPKNIVVDFEKAIHAACVDIWPNSDIVGCRFHLAQAWIRNIQKYQLNKDYEGKNEIGKWLGLCFGLTFFSPEEVSDVFVDELMSIVPDNPNVTKFADYLLEEYISEDATFPPEIWARCSAEINFTTNACESFHAHLAKCFHAPHPNIHLFIDALLGIQRISYLQMNSRSDRVRARSGKTKKYFLIKSKVEQYKEGKISKFDYLESVSWHYRKSKK